MSFQSLLWWIAVVNAPLPRTFHIDEHSFNPCCGGLQSSTSSASALAVARTRAGFNPCCGGLQSSTAARVARHRLQDEVSILVVVDCSRQRRRRAGNTTDPGVSILVVVDCSRQREPLDPCTCPGRNAPCQRRFQSLLWWIAVVNSGTRGRELGERHVSILVVVDCSRQRRALELYGTAVIRVSILVVVDCSRQPAITVRPVRHRSRVSILVVVDCSRQRPASRPACRMADSVSILVVVDCSRQRSATPATTAPMAGFNPCCGGLQSSTRPADDRTTVARGFNPCCGGLQSSTPRSADAGRPRARVSILVVVDCSRQRRPGDGATADLSQVSILVVVDCSRQPYWTPGQPRLHRVSILVVVDCSRQRWLSLRNWTSSCFNPCCGGLQSSTTFTDTSVGPRSVVSILVVVDCSRQRVLDRRAARLRSVSILVVVDCSRQPARTGSATGQGRSFNPCCGGLQSSTSACSDGPSPCRWSFNPCCGGLQSSTSTDPGAAELDEFQSLLWWIGQRQPESPMQSNEICVSWVSILVVVDCSRQLRQHEHDWRERRIRFQSLLWWIAVVNH